MSAQAIASPPGLPTQGPSLRRPEVLFITHCAQYDGTVQATLAAAGYRVVCAPDGDRGLAQLRFGGADLVLLDSELPGLDPLTVCRQIRAAPRTARVPVILLTANHDGTQRLQGFDAGADDCLTKPFAEAELVARIEAVLRRSASAQSPLPARLPIDERLTIGFAEQQVIVAGEPVRLRPTEARLLRLLVEQAGQTVPFGTILQQVWGPEYRDETHYVHLYVTYLRQKIEPDPSNPRYLHSNRGVGYSFSRKVPTETAASARASSPLSVNSACGVI